MSTQNTGGPAFPNVPDGAGDKWADWDKGISIRDYFATHAPPPGRFKPDDQPSEEFYAEWAYAYADAMLAERLK